MKKFSSIVRWNDIKYIFLVLKAADEADERRSTDENENEQRRRNDYDKSQPHQTRDSIHLGRREESKRIEDSLSESEQIHDNVPLRDNNDDINAKKERGVHVISPTDNTVNKWADIIKVNPTASSEQISSI